MHRLNIAHPRCTWAGLVGVIVIATLPEAAGRGEMGAAGSVRRAAKEEMNQLHEKALNREVDQCYSDIQCKL